MGFLVDWSAKPYASVVVECPANEATQGEYIRTARRKLSVMVDSQSATNWVRLAIDYSGWQLIEIPIV